MNCKIKLIVAFDEKYYIGKDNKLPWNIKEDLKLFKDKTKGKIVVMGRNTYDSLNCEPLKDRINIVLSNDPEWVGNLDASHIFIDNSLRIYNSFDKLIEKLEELDKEQEVFIIGGKSIYKQFLDRDLVDELYISHIYGNHKGDTKFSFVDWKKWKVVKKRKYEKFIFKKYKKVLDK